MFSFVVSSKSFKFTASSLLQVALRKIFHFTSLASSSLVKYDFNVYFIDIVYNQQSGLNFFNHCRFCCGCSKNDIGSLPSSPYTWWSRGSFNMNGISIQILAINLPNQTNLFPNRSLRILWFQILIKGYPGWTLRVCEILIFINMLPVYEPHSPLSQTHRDDYVVSQVMRIFFLTMSANGNDT